MPKAIGTFINELALKAGVTADNQALKDLLANADLSKVTVPDDLITPIESNLHTVESASANQLVKNKLFAQALNAVDKTSREAMIEAGFDDALISEMEAEKSTPARVKLIAKKILELESKKATAKGGDKQELINEINELKKAKGDITKQMNDAIAAIKAEHEGELTNYDLKQLLSGYNYALGDIDQNLKVTTALNALKASLQTDNAKVIRENGVSKLVAADGSKYYNPKNQTELDLKSYTEQILAANKLLKTTDPNDPGNKDTPKPTIQVPGSGGINNRSFNSMLDTAIAAAQAQN